MRPLFASISASDSGDNTIVAAVTGKKIKVLDYLLVAANTVSVTWKSDATAKSGAMPFAANGGVCAPPGALVFMQPGGVGPPTYWLETAAGEALILNLSGAVLVAGHLSYFLEE